MNPSDKLIDLIDNYNLNHRNLNEDQTRELRADISTTSFNFVEHEYKEALKEVTIAEYKLDQVVGVVFKELFEDLVTKHSQSTAKELASKYMKSDQRYSDANKKYIKQKNLIKLIDKKLAQANQVLNSMTKRDKF